MGVQASSVFLDSKEERIMKITGDQKSQTWFIPILTVAAFLFVIGLQPAQAVVMCPQVMCADGTACGRCGPIIVTGGSGPGASYNPVTSQSVHNVTDIQVDQKDIQTD